MDPTEEILANLIRLQRLANGLTGAARGVVDALIVETIADLAKHDPTAVQLRYRQGRVDKVLDNLATRSQAAYADLLADTRSQLARLGRQQSDWAKDILLGEVALGGETAITVTARGLGVNFFKKIVDTDPFSGHRLADWLDMADKSVQRRVRGELNRGLLNGETLGQITTRMRRTVRDRSRREVETVVRTATNYVANRAHFETYQANSDITKKYRYTATLDSKTSEICRALDGRVYKWGEGVIPPQHPNCRSIIRALVDYEGLGLEPPPTGERASEDGRVNPVSADVNYEQWLRADPARARRILKGRADLFLNKGVTLRDMVRRDGSVLTIDELEARVG